MIWIRLQRKWVTLALPQPRLFSTDCSIHFSPSRTSRNWLPSQRLGNRRASFRSPETSTKLSCFLLSYSQRCRNYRYRSWSERLDFAVSIGRSSRLRAIVNFLLGNGHRLTSPVKITKNIEALVVPYDLRQAKERLLPQCESAIAKFDSLPLNAEGNKRKGNVLVRKANQQDSKICMLLHLLRLPSELPSIKITW